MRIRSKISGISCLVYAIICAGIFAAQEERPDRNAFGSYLRYFDFEKYSVATDEAGGLASINAGNRELVAPGHYFHYTIYKKDPFGYLAGQSTMKEKIFQAKKEGDNWTILVKNILAGKGADLSYKERIILDAAGVVAIYFQGEDNTPFDDNHLLEWRIPGSLLAGAKYKFVSEEGERSGEIAGQSEKEGVIGQNITFARINTVLGEPLIIALEGDSRMSIRDWRNQYGCFAFQIVPVQTGKEFSVSLRIALPVPGAEKKLNAMTPDKSPFSQINIKEEQPAAITNLPDYAGFERPAIRDGIFFFHGRPRYLIGMHIGHFYPVWFSSPPPMEVGDDPIYRKVFDKETAERFGIDTVALWVGADDQWLVRNYPEAGKAQDKPFPEERLRLFAGLKGMPVQTDLASHFQVFDGMAGDAAFREKLKQELKQKSSWWHEYVPFCPEHPAGQSWYEYRWSNAVEKTLATGVINSWIYELFNEASYKCACPYNEKLFQDRLKAQYGDISALNKRWGGNYRDFSEVKLPESPGKANCVGEWIAAAKFIGDRFAEILARGRKVIKSVDKRDNIYVTYQPSYPIFGNHHAGIMTGIDFYKASKVCDVFALEGGLMFGGSLREETGVEETDREYEVRIHGPAYKLAQDIARSVSPDKPIGNFEFYLKRQGEDGKAAPTRKDDLITSFWNEVLREGSVSYPFIWLRPFHRTAEGWRTRAKEVSCDLLNIYAHPPEVLAGIPEFRRELEKLEDIVLPRPRLKGMIALLYSYPSMRLGSIKDNRFGPELLRYYGALEGACYPQDIIFEEQLPEKRAGQYRAIVLPMANGVYDDTPGYLEDYVKQGGVLITDLRSLMTDEYGKELSSQREQLLNVKQRNVTVTKPERIVTRLKAAENLRCEKMFKVEPGQDVEVLAVSDAGKEPLVLMRKLGKGRIYMLNASFFNKYDLSIMLGSMLEHAGISRPFLVQEEGKDAIGNDIETLVIDRGNTKLYYLVNWNPLRSRLVKFKINNAGKGKWYVTDPLAERRYLTETRRTFWSYFTGADGALWSGAQLEAGVDMLLKPQVRTLLLVTDKEWKKGLAGLCREEIIASYKALKPEEEARAREAEEKRSAVQRASEELNRYEGIKADKCYFIDLRPYVNMSLKDEASGDGKGGMFDEGVNDLRNMPVGRQVFSGVPFDIIDYKTAGTNACIVLRGESVHYDKSFLPVEKKGIAVSRKAKNIYFCHTAGWNTKKGDVVFRYIIHYADGAVAEAPVRYGCEISGWWAPANVPEAKIGWTGFNASTDKVGVYVYKWKNPNPEKQIANIDIVSARTQALPCIIAITGENAD